MPLLDWLNKPDSLQTARRVPYRLLEAVPELGYGELKNSTLAAAALTDKMVQSVGFDPLEIPQHLQHGNQYSLFDGNAEPTEPAIAEERSEFTLPSFSVKDDQWHTVVTPA